MTEVDRRTVLAGAAAVAAAPGFTAQAQTAPSPTAPAFEVKPLPFDPKAVPGLSERLLTSHHQNN